MAPKPKPPAPSSSSSEEYESDDNNTSDNTEKQQLTPMQTDAQNPNDPDSEQEEETERSDDQNSESDEEEDSGSSDAKKPVEKQAKQSSDDENSESEGSEEDEEDSDSDEKQEDFKLVPKQAVSQTLKSPTKQAILLAKQNSKSAQKMESTKKPDSEDSDEAEKPEPSKRVVHRNKVFLKKDPNALATPKKGNTNFSRIWTEEDEVKLLEWVVKCQAEEIVPYSDMEGFNEFMKKPDVVYKTRQVSDKICRMKKKCLGNAEKWEKSGDDCEKKMLELSKQIWGEDGEMGNGKSVGGKKKSKKVDDLVEGKGKGVESSVKSGKRKEVSADDSVEKESVGKRDGKKSKKLDLLEENVKEVDQKVKKASVGEASGSKVMKTVESMDLVVENGNGSNGVKSDDKMGNNVEAMDLVDEDGMESEQEKFWAKYPRLKEALKVHNSGLFKEEGRNAMLCDLSKIGDAWAEDMENKWKIYQAKEAELKSMELDLLIAETKMRNDGN